MLRVFERGVGETQACGTGSAAAAAAAHSWGLVGRHVAVHNPGGTLEVSLGDDEILLSGPVHKVASVVVNPASVMAGSTAADAAPLRWTRTPVWTAPA